MSQEPSVLLVDLPDMGAPFAQALQQVGRSSVFITRDQVTTALQNGRPLGIVALAADVPKIAEAIRSQDYPVQLPFFVLQAQAPGSIRPPLPEVTAVVPEGVEPGILALRIQQALQQLGGPRPRQATVLGMGSMSKPQALPSKPPSLPTSQLVGADAKAPERALVSAVSSPVSGSTVLAPSALSKPPAVPSTVLAALSKVPASRSSAPPSATSAPASATSAPASAMSAPASAMSSPGAASSAPRSASSSPGATSSSPGATSSSPDGGAKTLGGASTPPPIPLNVPGISATPPEVPWDDAPEPGIVSSAPPVVPKAEPSQPRHSQRPAVVSSAPPLPEIQSLTPSAPFIPDAAPLPEEMQKTLGELTSSPFASDLRERPPAESVPTHPPVALTPSSTPSELDSSSEDEWGRKKSPWFPRILIAAGVLAALGVGKMVLSGGKDGPEATPGEGAREAASAPPAATAAPTASPAPEVAQAKNEEAKAPASMGSPEPSVPEATGEAAFYKIEGAATVVSCEKALGKSAADFASAKKWRAAQLWKLARKSLMAGNQEEALKHMCEASFIDASGPATIGLAKYYLGQRGLEEAHAWATKAVDAASGANSKRTAQQVLGDVLSQMGKVDEARSVWLESFNLTSNQPSRLAPVVRNFINAAVKARKGGDPALAEQLLRRATTFEPDNVNASALLAATLLENGQKKLAKAWAERALQKKPGLDMAEEVIKSLGG